MKLARKDINDKSFEYVVDARHEAEAIRILIKYAHMISEDVILSITIA
jgi:hypothetical protein